MERGFIWRIIHHSNNLPRDAITTWLPQRPWDHEYLLFGEPNPTESP